MTTSSAGDDDVADTAALDDLLDRWVAAWAVSRGAERQRLGHAWLVHVNAKSRADEFFVAEPTAAELEALADLASGRQDAWVTVLGRQPAPIPAALEPLTHAERMMTVALTPPGAPDTLPEGVHLEILDGVAHATVTIDGELAARGQVVVSGSDAVFDRISTEEGFRRRGLASRVMSALAGRAYADGATTGLLMASVEGRSLYAALGWREIAPLQTFRGY